MNEKLDKISTEKSNISIYDLTEEDIRRIEEKKSCCGPLVVTAHVDSGGIDVFEI